MTIDRSQRILKWLTEAIGCREATKVPFFLALKEIIRNKSRFFSVVIVVALITMLVLFINGLAEGLVTGNRQFIENLNADLLIYQDNADLAIPASAIGRSLLNDIRRTPGVAAAGPIGFSASTITATTDYEALDVSLIGVEPGQSGEPAAVRGTQLRTSRGNEAVIGRNVADRIGLQVGDTFTISVTQGAREEQYTLTVVGITTGQQYSILPSIIVPFLTWDRVRPTPNPGAGGELISNVVAVRLTDPAQTEAVTAELYRRASDIEAADLKTAYQNTPGYTAQQNTLDTQRGFTLLIGVLVVGGFFQIQTIQKVPQIGVLKAIGTTNSVIAVTSMVQIVLVMLFGVLAGAAVTVGLGLALPPVVPIFFTPMSFLTTILSLLLMGPIGGLVAVRKALTVEPLTALGLGA